MIQLIPLIVFILSGYIEKRTFIILVFLSILFLESLSVIPLGIETLSFTLAAMWIIWSKSIIEYKGSFINLLIYSSAIIIYFLIKIISLIFIKGFNLWLDIFMRGILEILINILTITLLISITYLVSYLLHAMVFQKKKL